MSKSLPRKDHQADTSEPENSGAWFGGYGGNDLIARLRDRDLTDLTVRRILDLTREGGVIDGLVLIYEVRGVVIKNGERT